MGLREVTDDLIAHYTAAGWWHDRTIFDVVAGYANEHPDRLAFADQHERLTYEQLVARARSLAAWLLDKGLQSGDCVAVQGPNNALLPVAHIAASAADLLFVPMSDAWRTTEVKHLLGLSEARVLFVPAATSEVDFGQMVQEVKAELPMLEHVVTADRDATAYRDSLGWEAEGFEPTNRDPNTPRFAMISSGTTALPKISLYTDNNLWSFMRYYGQCIDIRPDDVAVGLAPANTGATGYVFPVLAPLLHGASAVLLEQWDPEEAVELLYAEHATLATAVPTQVIKILEGDAVKTQSWDHLRVFTNAGAPLPSEKAKELEQTLNCTVQTVYGATDGGVPVMTQVDDPADKRYTTVGRVAPDTDFRLVDPELNEVSPGETGEIIWRNSMKTFGYLNDPERTEEAFVDGGLYRSGDLGRLDQDGYLQIVGRSKDMIIRGGQNLSPAEIEAAVAQHPSVSEVSVIGIPDPVYGERACACVVLREHAKLDLDGLVEFLRSRDIAKFKFPERLEVFDDLPRSAGAKISKAVLRQELAKRTT